MTITKWWDYPRSPSVFVSFQCCPEEDLRSKLQGEKNYRIVGHKFRFTILLLIIKDYDEDDLRLKLQQNENLDADSNHLRSKLPHFFLSSSYYCDTIPSPSQLSSSSSCHHLLVKGRIVLPSLIPLSYPPLLLSTSTSWMVHERADQTITSNKEEENHSWLMSSWR